MDLLASIIAELNLNPGQTAQQLSLKLGVDKTSIYSLLYVRLKGQCHQDKGYRWFSNKEEKKKDQHWNNLPIHL